MKTPRNSILDPTNMTEQMETLLLCFEGITGSGKSSLIADMKKTCRRIGKHHDIYIDRYSASLWVYGRELNECLELERMILSRGLYIYLVVDEDVAWKREADSKKETYHITKEVVAQTKAGFEEYFTKHCLLPVIVRDSSTLIDSEALIREIEVIHEARVAGRTLSPFKA